MLKITRSCAIAAILAGLLRATASFVPETTANVYVLYFLIDLFLLTGVIGLYLSSMTGGRMLGRLGFVLMCSALLVLIARDIGVVTPNAYAVAAALFSLGLDLFAIQALRTRKIPVGIPIGWILSTIVGPVGFFVPELRFLFAISGLLFGIAFMGAGVVMWRLVKSDK
jgi:hypothetical protein